MRAFKTLFIAVAMIALAHPAMAQADPHHPAETGAADTKVAPADNLPNPSPDGSGAPMMGCPDMMGMMQMMKMMQSMQTMQMEMMQQMLEMQKSLAASPHEEPSP